ncbi:MAG TPA: MFS transporter [Myxococcales bacterium]|nr:MFS transporter [Myxococcales bacterium]
MRGPLRGVYFLYYGYVGAILGYLAPYLRGLGFTGEQIGAVSTAAQLVAAPAALLWGHLADSGTPYATQRASPLSAERVAYGVAESRAAVLRICALGALAAMSALPWARTPLAVGAVLVAHSAFGGAVVPLLDSLTMEWARGEPGRTYARTRLFGSLGFVVVAQGLGVGLAWRGDRPADPLVPLAAVACVAGYALLLHAAPMPAASGSARAAPLHGRDALALLRDRAVLLLLALCAIHWASCAPYHLLFGVLVRDRGLPSTVTGAGLALGVLAEVAALWAFPALRRRFDLPALLAAACLCTALRWWLVSRANGAAALILLQLFHALTFGLWWACAVEAMGLLVPVGLRATGQALFSALVFGAGNAAGYFLSGAGYQEFGGASRLFAVAAAVEVCALPLCAVAGRRLASAQAARAGPVEGGAPPGSA